MKKKIVLIALSFVLALSLCACGTTNPANSDNESAGNAQKDEPAKTEFNIGETWTVDGQWSLVVNSVTATEDRNEFAEANPAVVYILDYT